MPLHRTVTLFFLFAFATLAPLSLAQTPSESDPIGTLLRRGRGAAARELAQSILKRNPKNPQALFDMGRVALSEDKESEAADWFEKAVSLEPRNSKFHFWLGRAYGDQAVKANTFRQPFLAKKVQAQFEKARDLDPSNVDARFGLVEFYIRAPGFMGGGVDKALKEAAEIRKIDPMMGHSALAVIYRRQNKPDLVKLEYLAALKENPDRYEPYFWLGNFYTNSKQYQQAFDSYEALAKKDGHEMRALYQIGRTAAISGLNLNRGEQALSRYLGYTPKDDEPQPANAHFRLGQIYDKKGMKEQARKEYREALRLQPDLKDATAALATLDRKG